MEKEVNEMSERHWNYIRDILMIHGVDKEIIYLIGFHYRTAFAHGWKHAKEDGVQNAPLA